MYVHTSAIGAGASADPSPLTSPGAVPNERLIFTAERIPQTDQQPSSLLLGLKGTSGNTAVVSVWICFDDPQAVTPASRSWFLMRSGITVTAGQTIYAPAGPGTIYLQVTTASAAASTLYAKTLAEPYVVPAS